MTVITGGGQFEQPPDHAPREVSQPLSPELIQQQLDRAAANEQVLPPFNPPQRGPVPAAQPIPPSQASVRTVSRRPAVDAVQVETVDPGAQAIADQVTETAAGAAPAAVLTPPPRTSLGASASVLVPANQDPVRADGQPQPELSPVLPHMRAASNTDSPSRGQPTFDPDPGKRITGGFGEPSEGQYFPLDGAELKAVVENLLAELHTRIQDDLRFSIALTYPRIRVHVDIVVEAYAADGGFKVQKFAAPHEKTPIEVAERFGEEVAFIVRAERREFDEENQPADAPNAMRAEAGLRIPRKQRIESAAGIIYADQ